MGRLRVHAGPNVRAVGRRVLDPPIPGDLVTTMAAGAGSPFHAGIVVAALPGPVTVVVWARAWWEE